MTAVDWTKPIQTSDGLTARLVCSDRSGGEYNNVVLVVGLDGIERCAFTDAEGNTYSSPRFIINVPPEKKVRYLNMYEDGRVGFQAETRDEADRATGRRRIACVRVEYTVGQYDD